MGKHSHQRGTYKRVPCPTCGAGVGELCRTKSSGVVLSAYHRTRKALVTITPAYPKLEKDITGIEQDLLSALMRFIDQRIAWHFREQ